MMVNKIEFDQCQVRTIHEEKLNLSKLLFLKKAILKWSDNFKFLLSPILSRCRCWSIAAIDVLFQIAPLKVLKFFQTSTGQIYKICPVLSFYRFIQVQKLITVSKDLNKSWLKPWLNVKRKINPGLTDWVAWTCWSCCNCWANKLIEFAGIDWTTYWNQWK